MITTQKIYTADSSNLSFIKDESVDLIVTSPPYPMIKMWDEIFISQDNSIAEDLKDDNENAAFIKMNNILNRTWKECNRVLKRNGFICINIGNATRTFNDRFKLYPNHSKIIEYFESLNYDVLPDIIWSKPTNSLNKFMGSGMYPAGAYITYEHEYILIFRKGEKRKFNKEETLLRRQSGYFFEERNEWFSDIWRINGKKQDLKNSNTRTRSAAYPLKIPYRLINMYSLQGDTVLDPFCGTGTTLMACMLNCRNGIGIDIDSEFVKMTYDRLNFYPSYLNRYIKDRLNNHLEYIDSMSQEQQNKCYMNERYNFLVKTKQEKDIYFPKITSIKNDGKIIKCEYE